ncbi:MAG: LLM class flavin-dependent oxidoreductase [Thermoproteota archaeon]
MLNCTTYSTLIEKDLRNNFEDDLFGKKITCKLGSYCKSGIRELSEILIIESIQILHDGCMPFALHYDIGAVSTSFEPSYCLNLIRKVEEAGFETAWVGDHLLPWFHTEGHSPQAWVLMTSAAERTKKISIGCDVTVPLYRYHPIIAAHAFATMGSIYPGRIIMGVGTGEGMNEYPIIGRWPSWKERAEALVEAIELIRKFWRSEEYFDFEGKYFKVRGVFCYDKPKEEIPIYWSAVGKRSAFLAGKIHVNLMTVKSPDECEDGVVEEYESGLKIGGSIQGMKKVVYFNVAYGKGEDLLRKVRKVMGPFLPEGWGARDPREIEKSTSSVSKDLIEDKFFLCSNPQDLIEPLERYKKAGFDSVIVGDWGIAPDELIEGFRMNVIPYFRDLSRTI